MKGKTKMNSQTTDSIAEILSTDITLLDSYSAEHYRTKVKALADYLEFQDRSFDRNRFIKKTKVVN